MEIKFFWLVFSLKLLIFRLVITYFGTPPDCTRYTPFLSKFFDYTMLQGHLQPAMLLSFRQLAIFKGTFEDCLSDIYLLDFTKNKQAYRH